MAELNLKQIVDKLNTEFTGEHRKLVFWYDDAADFAENIDSMELENAKVYKLTKDNQFYTKYFCPERFDKEDKRRCKCACICTGVSSGAVLQL